MTTWKIMEMNVYLFYTWTWQLVHGCPRFWHHKSLILALQKVMVEIIESIYFLFHYWFSFFRVFTQSFHSSISESLLDFNALSPTLSLSISSPFLSSRPTHSNFLFYSISSYLPSPPISPPSTLVSHSLTHPTFPFIPHALPLSSLALSLSTSNPLPAFFLWPSLTLFHHPPYVAVTHMEWIRHIC